MKNNSGFTLIELLAVIVILAVISLIAMPRIMDAIDEARIGALRQNNDSVVKAAQNYIVNNDDILPREIGESIEISLQDLIDGKNLSGLSNPFSSNECSGYVLITKTEASHEYIPHINCFNDINSSLDDNLIGQWLINGDAIDYSLLNNHGIDTNIIPHDNKNGFPNKAVYFNGTDSEVLINNNDFEFEDEDDFTISLWIKRFDNNRSLCNYRYHLGQDSSFRTRGDDALTTYSYTELGFWHHITVTYEDATRTLRMYRDGQLVDSGVSSDSPLSTYPTLTYLVLGRTNHSGGTTYSSTVKEDLRIYGRLLNEDEINMIYNQTR